jgi:hypothetical protein
MTAGRKPAPDVDSVLVVLPAGGSVRLPVGEGLCASVHRELLGYDEHVDELLARPDGSILYASLPPGPRPETPLPGWVFKLGPSISHVRGAEGYFRDEHAMLVTHAGRTILVPPDDP